MDNKKLGMVGFFLAIAGFGIGQVSNIISEKKQEVLIDEKVKKAVAEAKKTES